MPSRIINLIVLTAAFISCHPEQTSYVSRDITSRELRAHVRYLASDELEGRGSGTQGNVMAARYIADQFLSYGLQPRGDHGTYLQQFQVVTGLVAGKNNRMTITVGEKQINFTPNEDFIPLSFSAETTVTAGVVFVGYGISSDSLHYDDYAGVDVQGKIVLVLRYTPDYGKPDSKFYEYAPLYRKAFTARSKGAVGMILVTGPSDEEKPTLIPLRPERTLASLGIAAVNLKSPLADSLLRWSGVVKNLRAFQQEIYDQKAPTSFVLANVQVEMTTSVERIYAPTANVIGYLEGSDPKLKEEVVVVGAHFDHVGWGGPGSGSLRSDTVAIHNGADDNASGTATMLEIAQALSAERQHLRRSYLFIGFSGEEMGLLGSAHYVKQPTVPLDKTVAMVNLDMVGRLRDSNLTVESIGSSPIWKAILEKENEHYHFKLRSGQGGFGSSDHASFYGKNIPVLFFFTGIHEDYHRSSDDWEKINYEGQKAIGQFALDVIRALDKSDKPEFTRSPIASGDTAMRRGFRVTLGIVPDYSESDNGLKITGTRAASPAEKAGLKGGDIITKIGGKDVKSIYDLTYILENYKPGDEAEVVFRRDGETKTATVRFEGRSGGRQ